MVDGYPIYFRGFRILNAVIEYMLENGMQNAERVILTGCSGNELSLRNVEGILESHTLHLDQRVWLTRLY